MSNLALVLLDVFLHLFFGPTWSKGVLGGLPTPIQILDLSSSTESLPGGEMQVRREEDPLHTQTVRAPSADRPASTQGEVAPATRSRTIEPRATYRPRSHSEHC
jgi:hypothetical protein